VPISSAMRATRWRSSYSFVTVCPRGSRTALGKLNVVYVVVVVRFSASVVDVLFKL